MASWDERFKLRTWDGSTAGVSSGEWLYSTVPTKSGASATSM
ncbi:hypothetical protein HMPREF9206_0830 [Cutibacterium acnes J139]|nr:hypothetical protein HMPREF9206_0830 [Cutibacterium acnes J139]